MGWLTKSLGLVTECKNCGVQRNLQQCPHCDAVICETCLEPLVNRDGWPDWMSGKKVTERKDLVGHIQTYLQKLKAKGGQAHCCKEFIEFRWKNIKKALRTLRERDPRLKEFVIK